MDDVDSDEKNDSEEIGIKKEWSVDMVKAVKLVSNRAAALTWLHDGSKRYFTWLYKISVFVFGACSVLGGSSLLPLVIIVTDQSVVIAITVVILAVGALTTILSLMSWNERASEHGDLSKRNTLLHIKCVEMLHRDMAGRAAPDEFLHQILKDEFLIYKEHVDIPKFVMWRYKKIFSRDAIPIEILLTPSLAGEMSEPSLLRKVEKKKCLCCCRAERHKVPEKTASSIITRHLHHEGRIKESVLDTMARLEDTISLISQADIEQVMRKHGDPTSPGTRRKHRHKPTPHEIFELERAV